MYFDTKKKEYKKDGRLSILKNRTIKMDYDRNLHRNDNDIFNTHKRFESKHNTLSRDDTIEKKLRETSPYFCGKKNENFLAPHIKSSVIIGEEKSKVFNVISLTPTKQLNFSKTISKDNNSNEFKQFSNTTNIRLYSPKFNNGNELPDRNETSKSNSNLGTKQISQSIIPKTFMNDEINNTKESEFTNSLGKNKGTCKSVSITTKTTTTNCTNTEDDKKLINQNNYKDNFEITNKKSRNKKVKTILSPDRKAGFTEVFGKKDNKMNFSPDKIYIIHNHASHDTSFHRQSFNIITCQEETINKSQDCTINYDHDTIHDKNEKSLKNKIDSQIRNREKIAKKIYESYIDERGKSKDILTDKMMNKSFEIKDKKYETISNSIKSNYKRTWIEGSVCQRILPLDINRNEIEKDEKFNTITEESYITKRNNKFVEKSSENIMKDKIRLKTSEKECQKLLPLEKNQDSKKKTKDELIKSNKSLIEVRRKREDDVNVRIIQEKKLMYKKMGEIKKLGRENKLKKNTIVNIKNQETKKKQLTDIKKSPIKNKK